MSDVRIIFSCCVSVPLIFIISCNIRSSGHKKVHDLDNTETCDQCGIVVKNTQALKRHKKKAHTENTDKEGRQNN